MHHRAPATHTIKAATKLWTEGQAFVTQPSLMAGWRADYEAAIRATLSVLDALAHSVEELVTIYFAGAAVLDDVISAHVFPPSARLLDYGTIEDAAYWRRWRALLRAAGEQTVE
jgi:hypothetical protein